MLKVRAMGSREEIRWFQELLANSQTIELMDFSEIFPCANTRRYYRSYCQVQKRPEQRKAIK